MPAMVTPSCVVWAHLFMCLLFHNAQFPWQQKHACLHTCRVPSELWGGSTMPVYACHIPVTPHAAQACLWCRPSNTTWQWGTPVPAPVMLQHHHLVVCAPAVSQCPQMPVPWACMFTPVMPEHQKHGAARRPVHTSSAATSSSTGVPAFTSTTSKKRHGLARAHFLCVSDMSHHRQVAGQAHPFTCLLCPSDVTLGSGHICLHTCCVQCCCMVAQAHRFARMLCLISATWECRHACSWLPCSRATMQEQGTTTCLPLSPKTTETLLSSVVLQDHQGAVWVCLVIPTSSWHCQAATQYARPHHTTCPVPACGRAGRHFHMSAMSQHH